MKIFYIKNNLNFKRKKSQYNPYFLQTPLSILCFLDYFFKLYFQLVCRRPLFRFFYAAVFNHFLYYFRWGWRFFQLGTGAKEGMLLMKEIKKNDWISTELHVLIHESLDEIKFLKPYCVSTGQSYLYSKILFCYCFNCKRGFGNYAVFRYKLIFEHLITPDIKKKFLKPNCASTRHPHLYSYRVFSNTCCKIVRGVTRDMSF